MLTKFKEWWRNDPKARFYVRTAVVAAAGYLVQAFRSGQILTWHALSAGAATAAITAIIGILTPAEPFIGKKAKLALVPSPPAAPEDTKLAA